MSFERRVFGGRYRAERALGQGGYGMVYEATDSNTGRTVALKLLRFPDMDEAARHRFAREARIVQQLSHPNTVRSHDFGVEPDGTQFIVYELLRGETLSQIIRRGPIPIERTIRVGMQVLKSLSEAHQHGIIHRDIKPANIMLVQFSGDSDVVKVLDFGVAKPLDAATRALTATGSLLGTPRFMSPEQVRGDPVGPGSDLYSLALVMAEMLIGGRLLEGSPFDVMAAHLSPTPISLPPLVRASPLGRILRRALEKDPSRRYSSAPEMLADIEAVRSGASLPPPPATTTDVVALPPPPPPPAGPTAMTWLVAGGGFVAIVFLLGGALAAGWYLFVGVPTSAAGPAAPAARGRYGAGVESGLRSFDSMAVESLMQSEGWSKLTDSDEEGASLSFMNGKRSATVVIVTYGDESIAGRVMQEEPNGPALARFGKTVVHFMVVDGELDPVASRAWRDRIVAYLKKLAK